MPAPQVVAESLPCRGPVAILAHSGGARCGVVSGGGGAGKGEGDERLPRSFMTIQADDNTG
jgi:hypothetical protein